MGSKNSMLWPPLLPHFPLQIVPLYVTLTCCICPGSWGPRVSRPGVAPAKCPLTLDGFSATSHHRCPCHETETSHYVKAWPQYWPGGLLSPWPESGPRTVPDSHHRPAPEASADCSQDSSPGQPEKRERSELGPRGWEAEVLSQSWLLITCVRSACGCTFRVHLFSNRCSYSWCLSVGGIIDRV